MLGASFAASAVGRAICATNGEIRGDAFTQRKRDPFGEFDAMRNDVVPADFRSAA